MGPRPFYSPQPPLSKESFSEIKPQGKQALAVLTVSAPPLQVLTQLHLILPLGSLTRLTF